jgi:hypothetical protein
VAIKNNTIYKLVNESIYQVELQCNSKMYPDDVIKNESRRLKKRIKRFGYPEDSANEAILEFTNYFNNVNTNNLNHKEE